MPTARQQPLHLELASLVKRLDDLRDILEQTALILSDYEFTLDSEERRAAGLAALRLIARVKAGGCSTGDGQVGQPYDPL
ncbi:MAG: hypothetical protein V4858_05185 [Pseudomonadota bacterium]